MTEGKLTKDEKKALRKLEWEEKAKSEKKNETIKKYSIWASVVAVIIFAVGGLMWLVSQPAAPQAGSLTTAPTTSKDISEGAKNPKVTLTEWADFECPACAAYHPLITQLVDKYKNQMLYVYRFFPLTNIHPNSHISAQAAYAANKQGAFFNYDDLLYNNQNDWANLQDPKPVFLEYAKKLKLNVTQFNKDMTSQEAVKYVNDSEQQALSEGLDHTPTFFINGKEINNPSSIEEFQKLIDEAIKQAATPTPKQ